jgi:hypothetical protein
MFREKLKHTFRDVRTLLAPPGWKASFKIDQLLAKRPFRGRSAKSPNDAEWRLTILLMYNQRSTVMKHVIIPLLLAASFIALSTVESSALVCARGVYRAGCVAAGGAGVVVGRPIVRPVGGVVVAPRVGVRRRVY